MKQKNILKLTAAAFAVIGTGTLLFNAAAETALASSAKRTQTVPTSYQVSNDLEIISQKPGITEESGGIANCQVSMDSLNTGTPADTDLTMEEAAEAGVRHLGNIFGVDLEGAYVYMMYNPGTVTFPRAFWSGDVLFEKKQTPESTRWTFMVDAVTGELFNAGHGRQLDANPPLGLDQALEKDCSQYKELARKKTEECGLMDGPVDRVEYNCQGYSGNDPDIALDVIGENGEMINMSFSRYDQEFLGIITDTSLKISESALERIMKGEADDDDQIEKKTAVFEAP